jgi:hypothetical protein
MFYARARNPIVLAIAAAFIVVGLATFIATRLVSSNAESQFVPAVPPPKSAKVADASLAAAPAGGARSASNSSPGLRPLIARTGSMNLLVANVDGVVEAIGRLAKGHDGVVFGLDTQNDNAPDSSASADMNIRIPASQFDVVMLSLAHLGTVAQRSVKAEDLTGDITDSGARLVNLRRTEADIRNIMDRSGSVSQIMDAEGQLSDIREKIETLESELKSMSGRVAYSSIDIHVAAEVQNRPAEPTAANQLSNALGAASHSLVQFTLGIVERVIYLLVFAPYVLVFAVAVWLIRLRLRKNPIRG